jgi:cytoskeleton protein RodZ
MNDFNIAPQNISVGQLLTTARTTKGLGVADVAKTLKIREDYILALEHDQFEGLPPAPYTLGFLRSMAGLYGIDAMEISQRYKNQTGMLQRVDEVATAPEAVLETQKPKAPIPPKQKNVRRELWWAVPVLLVLGLLGWWVQPEQQIVPSPSVTETVTPQNQETAQPEIEPFKKMDVTAVSPPTETPVTLAGAQPTVTQTPAPVATPTDAEIAALLEATEAQTPSVIPVPETLPPVAEDAKLSTETPKVEATPPATPSVAAKVPDTKKDEKAVLVPKQDPPVLKAKSPNTPKTSRAPLVLSARDKSWIRITSATGKKILEGTLRPGAGRKISRVNSWWVMRGGCM